VPRSEPADFLAGGKRVNIDTLEIRVIPDDIDGRVRIADR
jgi:peptide/nickel transport system substrate-binding protein